MKLRKLKSINEASDRDMLNYILASQLQILRRIDFLEDNLLKDRLTDGKMKSHLETTKQMVNNTDKSLDRINDYLELDDLEKGELNI